MGRYCHPDILNASLNYIRDNADKMVLCSQQPTTYAQANTTYKLAEVSLSSGDFTVTSGLSSGRRVIVAEKSSVPVLADGTVSHWALVDTSTSKLLFVSPASNVTVSSAGSFNGSTVYIEIRDPVAV